MSRRRNLFATAATIGMIVPLFGAIPPATAVEATAPTISVFFQDGSVDVSGIDWSGSDVTVTVDDPGTPEPDDYVTGPFTPVPNDFADWVIWFPAPGIGPGWTVEASDGNGSASLMIPFLVIDRVDTETSRVSGRADSGLAFDVDTRDEGQSVIAGASGDWSVVLSSVESEIGATWTDTSGDRFSASYDWPQIGLALSGGSPVGEPPPNAGVGGSRWPAGALVQLELVDDTGSIRWSRDVIAEPDGGLLDFNGNGQIETDIPASDPGPGWILRARAVVDGGTPDQWTTEKVLDIQTLRVDQIDHQLGTAAGACSFADGTELFGQLVRGIDFAGEEGFATTCTGGQWSTSWTVDAAAVPRVLISSRDAVWNSVQAFSERDRPRVLYEAETGALIFLYWDGGQLDLSVDGAPIGMIQHPGDELFRTNLQDFGIDPDSINDGAVLLFENTTQLKSLVFEVVAIDSLTPDGTVTGTAPPFADVNVYLLGGEDQQGPIGGEFATAGADGRWEFQIPGEFLPLDPRGLVRSALVDFDADANIAEVSAEPVLRVQPVDDVVVGLGFPEGETVTVVVDDDDDLDNGTLFEIERIVEGFETYFELNDNEEQDFDLVAGQWVTTLWSGEPRVHRVTDLMTTGADAASGVVSGVAAPGSEVAVEIDGGVAWRVVTAGPDGVWDANLTIEPLDPSLGGGSVDLQPGDEGPSSQSDDDGDSTNARWKVPEPRLEVDPFHDIVTALEFGADEEFTVAIDGTTVGTFVVELEGRNYWESRGQLDLYPTVNITEGDVVTATVDGEEIASFMVGPLSVTDVDTDADTISGTAAPLAALQIEADGEGGGVRFLEADEAGNWTADFGVEPPEGEGWGAVDLFTLRAVGLTASSAPGGSTVYREQGDGNRNVWAFPESDAIWTFELSGLSPVSLTVLDENDVVLHHVDGLAPTRGPSSPTVGGVDIELPGGQSLWWSLVYDLPSGVELDPGVQVRVTEVLFETYLTVRDLTLDVGDLRTDELSGSAGPLVEAAAVTVGTAGIGIAPAESGEWTTPACTIESFEVEECDEIDLTHHSSGLALAFSSDGIDPYSGNLTARTWSMLPEILDIDLPDQGRRRQAIPLTVTVDDIERPDIQVVVVDWGDGRRSYRLLALPWSGPRELDLSHLYRRPGTYEVTVTMSDLRGGVDTETSEIRITR